MILNLVILLGVMCSIGTTLTLPGIAGVVLTVGMAVDANVLIYERLREEMGQGKSMRGAISAAYSRAFTTIFDSHSTTLISAIILIYLGTGPVKGFGVTLTIGVALSLFTSLVMTRLIFDALLSRGWLNRIGMLHIIKNPNWDFMKWAKYAFVASWTIILIGLSYGIFVRGNNVLGIDFAGGDSVTMSFKEKIGCGQIASRAGQSRRHANPISEGRRAGHAGSRRAFRQGRGRDQRLVDHLPRRRLSCRRQCGRRSHRRDRDQEVGHYRLISFPVWDSDLRGVSLRVFLLRAARCWRSSTMC